MDAHQTGPGPQQTPNPAGLSEPEAFELEARNSHAPARLETLNSAVPSHYSPLRRTSVRFWRQHVSLAVPHVKCRDHLANERTLLAYLRSGLAFSMLGVVIAQLMRLDQPSASRHTFGAFIISVPLSCMCQIAAIIISITGGARYFKYQRSMASGTAVSGGWELNLVGILTLTILTVIFGLLLAIFD